jgi:hypothetical protein
MTPARMASAISMISESSGTSKAAYAKLGFADALGIAHLSALDQAVVLWPPALLNAVRASRASRYRLMRAKRAAVELHDALPPKL